jgi:hypothetical protein
MGDIASLEDSIDNHTLNYYSLRDSVKDILTDNTGDVTLSVNSGLAFTSGQTGLHMGTPSTITSTSTNAVTTDTHSHAISSGIILPTGTEGQTLYNNAGTWTVNPYSLWDDTNNRQHITSSAAGGKTKLLIENTNSDANGDIIAFLKTSASPADNDYLGYMYFNGNNDLGVEHGFAGIYGSSADVTDGTEDGSLFFDTRVAGTFATRLSIVGGNTLLSGSLGVTGTRVSKGWFTDLEMTNLPSVNGVALTTTVAKLNYLTSITGISGTATGKVVLDISPVITDSIRTGKLAYNATTWNNSTAAPTRDDVRDQFVKVQDSTTKGTGWYYSLRDSVRGVLQDSANYLRKSGDTTMGLTVNGTDKIIFQGSWAGHYTDASISNIGNILSIDNDRGGGVSTSIGLSTDIGFSVNGANEFSVSETGVSISKLLTIGSIPHATTDIDRFLKDSAGIIKYRTGAELLSDIGGQATLTNPVTGTGTANTLTKFTGTSTVGNASITDNGSLVTFTTPLLATSFQSSTNDVLFGNTSTTSEYMKFYYNGGAGYVSLRSNGTEVLKTTDNGVNALSGKPYLYNGGKYAVVADTATTVKATWEADDIRPATRKAIAGYVAANAAGGSVTSVTASSPLSSSGGATPDISLSGTISVLHGGTNLNYIAAGSVLAANSEDTYSAVTSTSGTKVLTNTAGTISWETQTSVLSATVSLSSAQILALHDTPITIVSAPGSGYAIQVIAASVFFDYGGTPYSTYVDLELYETGLEPQLQCVDLLDTTSDKFRNFIFINSVFTNIAGNASLLVGNQLGNPTSGNGTAKIYVTYRIITL